jgi:guanylate kinase
MMNPGNGKCDEIRALREIPSSALIFAMSAPSGTGKTTIATQLVTMVPNLVRSVSLNTRAKRSSEIDRVDYIFVTEQEFGEHVKAGNLVEHTEIYNAKRGTPLQPLLDNMQNGIDTICVVEWNGMRNLQNVFGDCAISIYIMPPSVQVAIDRITARGQDSSDEVSMRVRNITSEIAHSSEYDYCVVNDDLQKCVVEVASIIEQCRLSKHTHKAY